MLVWHSFTVNSVIMGNCFSNKNSLGVKSYCFSSICFLICTFVSYLNLHLGFSFFLLLFISLFFKFCSGVCFHLPSKIYTSSLLGCVHYVVSVEVWSCCTTIHSCVTPIRCPGTVCSIPPKDPTALSTKTRTPKSVVGWHSIVNVFCSYCRLHFDLTLVTWQLSLSSVKYLDQVQYSVTFIVPTEMKLQKTILMNCIFNNIYDYCSMINVCV